MLDCQINVSTVCIAAFFSKVNFVIRICMKIIKLLMIGDLCKLDKQNGVKCNKCHLIEN